MNVIRLAVYVAVFALMFTNGLQLRRENLGYFARRPALLGRSILAVIVLVPLVALFACWAVRPPWDVRVGLAVLAASPLAPVVMTAVSRARGDDRYGASLYLVLAVLSIVTTPVALILMGRALGFEAYVPATKIAADVARSVLAPTVLGLGMRLAFPRAAAKLARPLANIAGLVFVAVLLLVFAGHWRLVIGMSVRGYAALLLFSAGSLAVGHLLAPPDPAKRATLALESAARNPALALLIAHVNFPEARPATVLLPYLIGYIAVSALYSRWLTRPLREAHA